ncbi:hypothetical protein PGTUg99_020767 [Puccinia graminis f. sp. tritici]|uniref:Uncharacterized protein n=1 Tax=Puccinia graminis f. sp. tritici TaxID=56615 RepID=A0A5B0PFH3_PUCGR|nr:hypothetical protein PGTUg99_020767 [Puccinia graminis f. sp. tritici]
MSLPARSGLSCEIPTEIKNFQHVIFIPRQIGKAKSEPIRPTPATRNCRSGLYSPFFFKQEFWSNSFKDSEASLIASAHIIRYFLDE